MDSVVGLVCMIDVVVAASTVAVVAETTGVARLPLCRCTLAGAGEYALAP